MEPNEEQREALADFARTWADLGKQAADSMRSCCLPLTILVMAFMVGAVVLVWRFVAEWRP